MTSDRQPQQRSGASRERDGDAPPPAAHHGGAADGTRDELRPAGEIFVVDRREGRTIIVITEDARDIELPASRLPKSCRMEGAVLRVPRDAHGQPAWENAVRDHEEEARRLADLRARVARLRRSDPGGDVVL